MLRFTSLVPNPAPPAGDTTDGPALSRERARRKNAADWTRPQPTQVAGERRSELEHPAPDGLIGDFEPTLGQELLDISVAQCEPEIEPDGVSDDVGWNLVACVGDRLHPPILPAPVHDSRDKAHPRLPSRPRTKPRDTKRSASRRPER